MAVSQIDRSWEASDSMSWVGLVDEEGGGHDRERGVIYWGLVGGSREAVGFSTVFFSIELLPFVDS